MIMPNVTSSSTCRFRHFPVATGLGKVGGVMASCPDPKGKKSIKFSFLIGHPSMNHAYIHLGLNMQWILKTLEKNSASFVDF